MTNEVTLDELEINLAGTAAHLLKITLQIARLRAHDAAATAVIDGVTACRLIVAAAGPDVQIELVAPLEGGTQRLYGATFSELPGRLH